MKGLIYIQLNDIHGSISLIIRQFPGEKYLVSSQELKQSASHQFLSKADCQQEYVNRDQGFSQGYSECSVGHMKLGFPFQYFSYLKC
jgi:hypothetical protein